MPNKFGIGIITTQDRTLHLNYLNLIDQSTTVMVETDLERTGVANTRNRVLKKLYDDGCEYIVLFDDDCFPIQRGWQSYLEQSHKRSNVHVLIMPTNNHVSLGTQAGIEDVRWGIGAFTSLTRKAIETIGYFNTEYDTYGYEDVGYLFRARRAGLSYSYDADSAPERISEYIFSTDVGPNSDPVPDTLPQEEKDRLILLNRPVFVRETTNPENYYPYVG